MNPQPARWFYPTATITSARNESRKFNSIRSFLQFDIDHTMLFQPMDPRENGLLFRYHHFPARFNPMPNRKLQFSNLDEIRDEVDRLYRSGYVSNGKWDLGQICDHLADWMGFAMDGFPKSPFFVSVLLSMLRVTQGKRLLRKVLETGEMGSGSPTLPQTVHARQDDPGQAIERLAKMIDRLQATSGPFHPSPLFGAMTKQELLGLHLVHCAHHLSYLQPNDSV